MRLRFFDYLALLIALSAVAVSSLYAYSGSQKAEAVTIESVEGEAIYPLNQDRHVPVKGPLGVTEVVIESGTARVVDSPCPGKTCIAEGRISRPGAWIACLPNRVSVRISGASDKGIDATVF